MLLVLLALHALDRTELLLLLLQEEEEALDTLSDDALVLFRLDTCSSLDTKTLTTKKLAINYFKHILLIRNI